MIEAEDAKDRIIRLQQQLNLSDWTIIPKPSDTVFDARVDIEREARRATLTYNPDRDDAFFYIGHEMVHVLLSDMDFLACNGRSLELMEMYNLLEERVCNVIAAIL